MISPLNKILGLMVIAIPLFLVACGEEPEEKDDAIILITDDMSTPSDQSNDQPEDMGADLSNDQSQDMIVDQSVDQSMLPPGCDAVGFMPSATTASRTASLLSVTSSTNGPSKDSLTFYLAENDLKDGNYTFKDENFKTCTVCLALQTNCVDGSCDATYVATEGNAAVSTSETNASLGLDLVRMVQVSLDDELNSTKIPNGKTYCLLDPVTLAGPLTIDRCSDAPVRSLADVTCGPAPLAVQFTAPDSSFERIDSVRWDFGDGGSSRETNPSHTFSAGEWRVEVEIRGIISGFATSITSPQMIKVY